MADINNRFSFIPTNEEVSEHTKMHIKFLNE